MGAYAFGLLVMLALLALVVLFFYGAAWVGEKVLPVLEWITFIGFLLLVVIGSPLAIFRKTRFVTGQGWFYWSYVVGLMVWLSCLIATLQLWGVMAAIIGIVFCGVGVFVTGLLAAAFHGEWSFFWQSLLMLVIVFASRLLGIWLMMKSEPKNEAIEVEQIFDETK